MRDSKDHWARDAEAIPHVFEIGVAGTHGRGQGMSDWLQDIHLSSQTSLQKGLCKTAPMCDIQRSQNPQAAHKKMVFKLQKCSHANTEFYWSPGEHTAEGLTFSQSN